MQPSNKIRIKNLEDAFNKYVGLTGRAVESLDNARQEHDGHNQQLAEYVGHTQVVVSAVIEVLGIEDRVREVVARIVDEAKAAKAKAEEKVDQAMPEVPAELVEGPAN